MRPMTNKPFHFVDTPKLLIWDFPPDQLLSQFFPGFDKYGICIRQSEYQLMRPMNSGDIYAYSQNWHSRI